jgi:glycosyltransferase involved in cell wall biosynthesis
MTHLAHIAIVTPHKAGLYETVRDLVAAERANGADAIIVDPNHPAEDRGVPVAHGFDPGAFDCIINHSGLGQHAARVNGTPIIHCLHGRPESSFTLESTGKLGVYSFLRATSQDPRYKLWVTFWRHYRTCWELLVPPEKLRHVTAPVDLKAWSPDGPKGYQFRGKRGDINVVCADMWREDKTPYHVIHGFCEFAKTHPGSRLHLYGVLRNKAIDVLLEQIEARGWLGEVAGYVKGLDHVYRATTLAISPHRIATRSIREALACGCPVVADCGSECSPWACDPENYCGYAAAMDDLVQHPEYRSQAREWAEKHFDANTTARQMLNLVQEVTTCQR